MRIEGLINKRVCFECGSDKTYVTPKGYSQWRVNKEDKLICRKCFDKQRIRTFRNPEPIKRANDRGNAKRRGRWHSYKGKRYTVLYDLRCGVCNWCRAVVGIDTSYTNLHHDENRYDDSNWLKYTIELCVQCHGKESARLKKVTL